MERIDTALRRLKEAVSVGGKQSPRDLARHAGRILVDIRQFDIEYEMSSGKSIADMLRGSNRRLASMYTQLTDSLTKARVQLVRGDAGAALLLLRDARNAADALEEATAILWARTLRDVATLFWRVLRTVARKRGVTTRDVLLQLERP